MNVKEEAKAAWLEDRKEEAKKNLQGQVNSVLNEISDLSHRLRVAKERFSKLEYIEPETLELDE